MYYDFFGFREPPFSIAPDPRYLYLSERHKEALAHLMYGVKGQGGFIVITGEVGTGKTTVSRCFIENVPDSVDIALILNPRLSARELLSSICDELEIPHPVGATIKQLVDLINQDLLKAHAAGRHKVLMIDEAQNLSADVLEQLRLLTNLETAEKKLLQIVLLGQPELQDMLARPELRQLNQRVTARYHLGSLPRDELPAYLRYRIGVAGLRGDIFTDSAIRHLYRASHGIPRLINLISDRALLGAYAEGVHEVSGAHIRTAAREVIGPLRQSARRASTDTASRRPYYWPLVASLLGAIVLTGWLVDRWPVGAETVEGRGEASEQAALSGAIERTGPPSGKVAAQAQSKDGEDSTPELASFDFQSQTQTLSDAFQTLFGIWGLDYQAGQNALACGFATEQGLRCLERQGSRRSLEHLNRPAILKLSDSQGSQGYVVVRALNDQMVELATASGNRKVAFSSLEDYWFGEFTVLWRLPPYMTGDERYASASGEQLWLGAQMMELADQYAVDRQESDRVKRLSTEEQVRWYQQNRGLTVDGIPGAMTLIQMSNDLNPAVPRLDTPGRDS